MGSPIVVMGALLAALFAATNASAAGQSASLCRAGVSDDMTRPLPASLAGAAGRLFGLHMPDDVIRRTVVYRCMDGKIMLCSAGANLPCGKANVSRDLPGAADWCRTHAEADYIPMFATGHDTIYRWRCTDGRPRIDGTIGTVDARGFVARYWKEADGK